MTATTPNAAVVPLWCLSIASPRCSLVLPAVRRHRRSGPCITTPGGVRRHLQLSHGSHRTPTVPTTVPLSVPTRRYFGATETFRRPRCRSDGVRVGGEKAPQRCHECTQMPTNAHTGRVQGVHMHTVRAWACRCVADVCGRPWAHTG